MSLDSEPAGEKNGQLLSQRKRERERERERERKREREREREGGRERHNQHLSPHCSAVQNSSRDTSQTRELIALSRKRTLFALSRIYADDDALSA
jgi:hypothetical protein